MYIIYHIPTGDVLGMSENSLFADGMYGLLLTMKGHHSLSEMRPGFAYDWEQSLSQVYPNESGKYSNSNCFLRGGLSWSSLFLAVNNDEFDMFYKEEDMI